MKNIWFHLFISVLIIPIGWVLRSIIVSILKKVFNDGVLINSFKINSLIWIFLLFLFVLIEIIKVWLSFSDVNQKFLAQLFFIFEKIDKLIVFVFIVSLFAFVSAVIIHIIKGSVDRVDAPLPNVEIFYNLIRIILILIGVITALWYMGVPMAPVLTTLGVGGLAVSLALQGILSNLFSGINILFSKIFEKGDYIKVDNQFEGFVEDITWFSTTLLMRDNNRVIIPNSKIVGSIITNYHKPTSPMTIVIPVGVSYSCDLEKVEQVTIEVAKEVQKSVQGADPDFEPFIRYKQFTDSSINFNVIMRVLDISEGAHFVLTHEFIKKLKKRYDEEGIEMPFQTICIKKDNCVK